MVYSKKMPLEEQRRRTLASKAKYRAVNKEKIRLAEKARREADPTWNTRSAANTAKWRSRHPEKAKAVSNASHKKSGWAAGRRWYTKNRVQQLAKLAAKIWTPEQIDRRNSKLRAKYAADPVYRARIQIYAAARRQWAEEGDLTVDQWLATWDAYDGRCAYCFGSANSMDHVIPRVRGGTNTKGNVVPACRSCNSRKRHRLPFEWLGGLTAPNPDILRNGDN